MVIFHDGPDSWGLESGIFELSGNYVRHLLKSSHSTNRSDSCSKVSLPSLLNAGDSNLMSAKSYLCRSDYSDNTSRRCLCPVFQDRNLSRSVPGLNLLHAIHCPRLSISTPDLICTIRLDDRKHEEKLADFPKLFLLLGYLLALIFRAIRNLESSFVAAGEKLAVTFRR
uniref:Uncharacterized protein n=1 Tax=Romanomermis culicivorax TaxID=13658 RepID=A0A915KHM3_ROMCU